MIINIAMQSKLKSKSTWKTVIKNVDKYTLFLYRKETQITIIKNTKTKKNEIVL